MNIYIPTVKRKLFAIVFLWSLVIFLPGAYSVDSYNYFYQFSNNTYNDWHPPILAFVWKMLYNISGYYEMLYAVQMAMYWYMGYILAGRLISGRIAFWVCIGLLLLFQFIPQYIMKDTQAVVCWGIASLLMIEEYGETEQAKRRIVNIGIFLLLAYGLWVRVNAFLALVPLLILFIEHIMPAVKATWKKAAIILSIIAGLFFINHILTYKVFKAEKTYPEYKLMLLDITGITKKSGDNYLPAALTGYQYFDRNKLMEQYDPASFDHIYWPQDGTPSIVPSPTAEIAASVSKEWKKAIIHHPVIYLQNRIEGFLYYLRIKHRFARNEYWNIMLWIETENPIKVRKPDGSFSYKFSLGSFTDTIFFDPWFWLLLNIALAVYFFRKYKMHRYAEYRAMAMVQLSGILYTLSQLLVYQHDRDFRYNYWNLIVFLLGFVYMIGKPIIARRKETT